MTTAPLTVRRKLRYATEASIFFAFMGLFRLIGLDAASALGGWIGRNIFSRLPPDRIARANIALAFPAKNGAWRNAVRVAMWNNLGRVVAEYAHLEKFRVGDRIKVIDNADAAQAFMQGRGVMFLSGHLANWEMMPITGRELGFEGATVVRHPNNPYVARWIAKQRALRGPSEQIGKHSGARRIFSQLRGGKAIYMLVDQKNDEGMAVPFLGHDAMTTPVPAALVLKLGAQILFASNRRVGGSHFEVTIHPGLDFVPTGDEAADTRALTAAINDRIGELVRADPAQWLWIHRRWGKGPAH